MAIMACHKQRLLIGLLLVHTLMWTTWGQTCPKDTDDDQPTSSENPWINTLSNKSVEPPEGIGYMGRGFDIYRGNLLSSFSDSGFRMPVVHLDYQTKKRTLDNSFLIPDKSDLLRMVQSNPNTSNFVEVRTPPDFLRLLNKKVKVYGQLSLADGRFQASREFQQLLGAFGRETVLYSIEERPLYLASLEGNAQKATKSFVDMFNELPKECSAETRLRYMDFISAYGTHVTTHVTLGEQIVTTKTLTTEEVMAWKEKGKTIQDAFSSGAKPKKQGDDIGDFEERFKNKGIAIAVQVTPLPFYITSSFLGKDTISDITPRRDCLTRSIKLYCQAQTNQICRTDDSTGSLRYGDEIQLSTSIKQVLQTDMKTTVVGGGVVGNPLVLGASNTDQQMPLLILPAPGQTDRLGEPVMYGDIFSLASPKYPENLAQLSLRIPYTHMSTSGTENDSGQEFRGASSRLDNYGPQIFIASEKVIAYDISFETSKSRSTVVDAGPWSLTVETSRTSQTFLVDPCINLCLPGTTTVATITLPLDSGEIHRILMKPIPQWSGISTREGTWPITLFTLKDVKSNKLYMIGPFEISSESSPCERCAVGDWSSKSGITVSTLPTMLSQSGYMVTAESYFMRAKPLSYESLVVSNSSEVILHIRGLDHKKEFKRCAQLSCQNGGECQENVNENAQCKCTSRWTGPACSIPCVSEVFGVHVDESMRKDIISPPVFGSTGYFSNSSLQWVFSSMGDNFAVIALNNIYKVSAIQISSQTDTNSLQFEAYDIATHQWKSLEIRTANAQTKTYFISGKNGEIIVSNKLKILYRKTSLPLDGLKIYGCVEQFDDTYTNPSFSVRSFSLINRHRINIQTRYDENALPSVDQKAVTTVVKISFELSLNNSMQCDTDRDSVLWAIARQLDSCPSLVSINNIQEEANDLNKLRTISVEFSISGPENTVIPAKNLADKLIASGQMSLDCVLKSMASGWSSVSDIISATEVRLIIVMAVLLLLVLICLVLFIVFFVKLSHKYRDIHNELTTIRKLKMQKRIAKRQELQPQVPYHSFTLPRPNSAGSSSATTSIPGRNGQTRTLRYSQSLHGQNDRSRASTLSPASGRGSIDPTNYIISNPAPVIRTPSPGGTKSGEDSDTVQSLC